MAVTSLETILGTAPVQPEELTLPGWRPNTEITVRVRRPSLYAMLAANAALNPLIPELNKLFVRHDHGSVNQPTNAYARALVAIAKECLVEPTYAELEAAGVRLTDEQLLDLSLYATEGMEWLCSFRARIRNGARKHGGTVPDAAQPAAAPERSADGVGAGRRRRTPDPAPAQQGQAATEKD